MKIIRPIIQAEQDTRGTTGRFYKGRLAQEEKGKRV